MDTSKESFELVRRVGSRPSASIQGTTTESENNMSKEFSVGAAIFLLRLGIFLLLVLLDFTKYNMLLEILKNWDMSRRWESNWLPFRFSESEPAWRQQSASSLEFVWRNVGGNLNGKINLYVSNNQKTYKLLKSFDVASVANETDSLFLSLYYPSFEFFKIVFEPYGITSGQLYVGILYN